MSKIYEALVQAELDRAATKEATPDAAVPLPPSDQRASSPPPEPLRQQIMTQPVAPKPVPIEPPVATQPVPARAVVKQPAVKQPAMKQPEIARSAAAPATQTAVAEVSPNGARAGVWRPSLLQLPALEERGSAVEQFRSLRSRMHEFRDLNTLKSIIVSSGLPQEGKSYIAANLAISFARHKAARVLLIDGDMRRGCLHQMLGCPNEPGLTEYLSGKASLSEILQRAQPEGDDAPVLPGIGSLSFIACGSDHDNAADLSGNSRFGDLIDAVSPSFDWIVVDSSPVNLVADGVNLARACDGALLIARGGVTKFEVAQRALSELKASRILGFVLNAVENPPATGGYYGYDRYDSYDTIKE